MRAKLHMFRRLLTAVAILATMSVTALASDQGDLRLRTTENLYNLCSTPAENQEAFQWIRHHTTTPIAVGEIFNSIWDCKALIEKQLIDYIRTTVVHAGGITHLRRIADLASLYQVRTGCHGATDLSPVCMGAALHFGLAV